MNQATALRYVAACEDDLFLAAWIAVLDEHKLGSNCVVPPDDWWESFQRLHSASGISDIEFDSVNVRRRFYSDIYPNTKRVSDALILLKQLRAQRDLDSEVIMSKKEESFSLFENDRKQTGIATRNGNGHSHALAHGERQRTEGVKLFEGSSNGHGHRLFEGPPPATDLFQPAANHDGHNHLREAVHAALSCQREPGAVMDGAGHDPIYPEVRCCGTCIQMDQEDGDFAQSEAMGIGKNFLEYLFHGQCPACEAMYHFTKVQPIGRDEMRR